jgi:hypothetical protein
MSTSRQGQVTQFLVAKACQQQRREDRFFCFVALGKNLVEFLLGVRRRLAAGFGFLVFQRLEARAGVFHADAALICEEVEERA